MGTSNFFLYEVERHQDLLKVDIQLRDMKDLFITCPPLSGLSAYLKQIQKHILVSEHFREYKTFLFDCGTQNNTNNIINAIALFAYYELGIESLSIKRSRRGKTRFISSFEEIAKQSDRQKNVFIVDNLEKVPQNEVVELLENVRVIAESRSKNPYLRNIVFILAGHSLDLRKLDPKHSSPFNTATQIYLDDLPIEDSITYIKNGLLDKRYSALVPEYIDFLTHGHPYLINQICYHIRNEEIKMDSTKGVNFEFVDSILDIISNEKRDAIFRCIDDTLDNLSPTSTDALRKLLNGSFFKNIKFPEAFKELRLMGLINNNRNNKWQIRNHVFDSYIRQHSNWTDTIRKNNFVPRRLFVNIEGYKILFDLENNLREFIISQLFDAFGADWEKTIEGNSNLNKTVKNWKNMKTGNTGIGWLTHDDLPSLCYGLFPEMKEIIDFYWGGMFEKYFKPKTIFEGTFESLEDLRNKIAHNRPLSDQDVDVLTSIAKQFNECMYENSLS